MDKKNNQNDNNGKAEQGSGDHEASLEAPEAANATSGGNVANQQANSGASASNTSTNQPQANRVRDRERPHNRSTASSTSSTNHGSSNAASSCVNANSHVSRIQGKVHHHHHRDRHRDAKTSAATSKERHLVHQPSAAAAVAKGTPSSSSPSPSADKESPSKASGIQRAGNTNVVGAASLSSKNEAGRGEQGSPPPSLQCFSSSPPSTAPTEPSFSASSSSSSSAPVPDDEPIGAEALPEAVNNDDPRVVLQISPPLPHPTNGARLAEYFPPIAVENAPSNNPVQHPPSNPSNSHNHVHNAAMYNWQASKCTLKERLAFMFNNDTMADVHFVVGRNPHTQRIPAHKFVLAIGSAVFDAMFNGGMATTSDEIEIPDVEPAAFMALLKFLYSDDVQIDPEIVMTTLYTAKKYAVPALERACVEFLKRNLSSDNAFMLLTQARLFDEPQLAGLCLETIDKNTSEALSAEGFTDIDLDTLCVVLERDTLGIRECKLFHALCRWSEAECNRQNITVTSQNKRQCLGRGLSLIRFPLMTVEEFAMGPAQSNLLVDREVVELFLYFTVNPKPVVSFSETPRCCLTGKEQVVSRFCQIESRWGYSGTSDRIRFMVNRRIFVVGFGLYGSIHGPAEYTVNIQIIHTDTGKVCGQSDTSFQCDGTNSTFRVMFKEPVEIQPNTSYTACATLKGPDSYYGTKGLRKVTHESISSGKVTFQFTYAAGNNNGTSVEDGQLPEIIFYT